MDYLVHVLILVGIAAMLGTSYNLVAGYAGLLSICHAGFYGLGAYASALLTLRLGLPFGLALIGAVAVCMAAGLVVAWPSLRVKDDDFVIATFAFQILLVSLLQNLVGLTGGPMGIPGIPEPSLLGWTASAPWQNLLLVLAGVAILTWIAARVGKSPFGRVLGAIREDETLAAAAGKNVASFKIWVFVLSAGLAAIPGVLHAHYISFIDPSSFTIMESVFVISIVVVGGAGSITGPLVGAAVLVVLPELLRFVGLPTSVAANVRQIIYGAALAGFMLLRPQGLVGRYSFGQEGNKE